MTRCYSGGRRQNMINDTSFSDLERADRAIEAAERQILEQAALVAHLQAKNLDARLAEGLLGEMEIVLNALRAQRDLALIASTARPAAAEVGRGAARLVPVGLAVRSKRTEAERQACEGHGARLRALRDAGWQRID